ncbi:uncharacterized protein C18orf63 isoform X2 [Fundulus heteroclitus]|uniref:uncharacterized protein C18orf63 isoform X2 n=1 Tax=Fundulus heteroclitus TaxID=8078 RepID=UPI00165BC7E1|nr:uncharacterized protein C18orf63 isoform X2 [Fundulus heteroclitus]
MSGVNPKSLFFLGLPDLNQLVCVTLSLQDEEDQEPRSKQIKTCRELVLLYSDILACPALDSLTDITAVMASQFFQSGVLQAFAARQRLQLGGPQRALPGDLQCCVSYSLIARLPPRWNKAGLYLLAGDFLMETGRLDAVSMELSTSEGQLCFSLEAYSVRLPPPTLEDFELPALVLRRFCSDPEAVLHLSSAGRPIWCHVLPSMKKGQIITISRQLPPDGPFRTYRDLQSHWNRLYGYRLPDLEQQETVYCSVYFRPVGDRLFTYPLICVRLQPAQRCPRVDPQAAPARFLSDVRTRLQSVCGFPTRMTSRPSYPTARLNTAAAMQVLSPDQVNLTVSLSQPPSTSSRLQPPWVPLSQQEVQTHRPRPGSSFCQNLRPASSLSEPPRLVPIFRTREPSRLINVALLRAQRQPSGTGPKRHRIALPVPVGSKSTVTAASLASLSASSLPLPPPRVPRFGNRPKNPSGAASRPSGQPRVNRISSLSPVSRRIPALIVPPKPRTKSSRTSERVGPEDASETQKTTAGSGRIRPKSIMKTNSTGGPEGNTEPEMDPPPTASEGISASISKKKKVVFELKEEKPRKSKASVEDVQKLARSNQWSRLSCGTMLLWLKQRGVPVGAAARKEELMVKVMSCLAEA